MATKKNAAQPEDPRTPDEREQERLESRRYFWRSYLERKVEEGAQARAKVAEAMSDSDAALSRFQWLEAQAHAVVVESLAQRALAFIEHFDGDVDAAAKQMMGECVDALLNNHYRAGSTSHYANALNETRRGATSDFLDQIYWSYPEWRVGRD